MFAPSAQLLKFRHWGPARSSSPLRSLTVRNFSTIRFVLKKKKVAANWLFDLFLTLSFTFMKITMVGSVNLVSYGHFNFPCMHKLRPLVTSIVRKMLLFNFARKLNIWTNSELSQKNR